MALQLRYRARDDAQFRAEMSFRRIIDVYMEEKLDGRGADIPAS